VSFVAEKEKKNDKDGMIEMYVEGPKQDTKKLYDELKDEDKRFLEDMTMHTELFSDGQLSSPGPSVARTEVSGPVPPVQGRRSRVHLSRLHDSIADTVRDIGLEGDFPQDLVERAVTSVYYKAVDELIKSGLLSDKVLGMAFDLKERIKKYLADHRDGVCKTDILKGIGRNNIYYNETADFVLDHMVRSGVCVLKGKRYSLK
jgi:hypothetical protein